MTKPNDEKPRRVKKVKPEKVQMLKYKYGPNKPGHNYDEHEITLEHARAISAAFLEQQRGK